jgi:hypothetical protein
MDKQTKPTGKEVEVWLQEYSGESPSIGSTVSSWTKEAKEIYSSAMEGAKYISTFSSS